MVLLLKRAKRARVSFEPSGESLDGMSLIIDTELIRYKWVSVNGSFPEWEKLIPTEHQLTAHFDTVEAIKAVNSLKAIADSKAYPIDLTIGDGKIVMANPDEKGQAELVADTDGEGYIRVDGGYLADAFRACGGMVDFKLTNAISPMLFTSNGYKLVVMPMLTDKAQKQAKTEQEAKATAEPIPSPSEAEAKPTEPVAEQTEPTKPKKARRNRQKEPVAV